MSPTKLSKPFDIKCGHMIMSNDGKQLVFPTEEEAWDYYMEKVNEYETQCGRSS